MKLWSTWLERENELRSLLNVCILFGIKGSFCEVKCVKKYINNLTFTAFTYTSIEGQGDVLMYYNN